MSRKRNTSLVAFQCPAKLLTMLDDYSYENMMDRTDFIIAAISKFIEYYEHNDELELFAGMSKEEQCYLLEEGLAEEAFEAQETDESDFWDEDSADEPQ